MEAILAVVVGVLYATGLYMMLRRNILKLAIGLSLLSHASNLLIFTSGGLVRGNPPILREDLPAEAIQQMADPLPQALILTAIVISFGVLAFAIVLIHRVYGIIGSDDVDEMKVTDQ